MLDLQTKETILYGFLFGTMTGIALSQTDLLTTFWLKKKEYEANKL